GIRDRNVTGVQTCALPIYAVRETRKEAERRIPTGDRKLLYRELPKLVNEVKPLLVSAKRIGLEIDEGKRIINDAIQAGKGRDIEIGRASGREGVWSGVGVG